MQQGLYSDMELIEALWEHSFTCAPPAPCQGIFLGAHFSVQLCKAHWRSSGVTGLFERPPPRPCMPTYAPTSAKAIADLASSAICYSYLHMSPGIADFTLASCLVC